MTSALTLDELRGRTTVSIATGGAFLGISVATAYRAAASGSLPTIVVGKTRRVPVPQLLALVGLDYETGPSGVALPSNNDGGQHVESH